MTTSTSGARPTDDELGLAPSSSTAELLVDDDEIVGVESVDVIDDAVPVIDVVEPVVEAIEAGPSSPFGFDSRPPARSSSGYKSASGGKASNGSSRCQSLGLVPNLRHGGILAILCVAGFFLVNWMRRGSADDAIKVAEQETYEQRQYDVAKGIYQTFANSWKSHEKASYAKTRAVLAAIRKDIEGSAHHCAENRRSTTITIVDEPGLADEQADLAGGHWSVWLRNSPLAWIAQKSPINGKS